MPSFDRSPKLPAALTLNTAPELRVSLIAIAARDRGLLNNVGMQMSAIDGSIGLLARTKRPFKECVAQLIESLRKELPLGCASGSGRSRRT